MNLLALTLYASAYALLNVMGAALVKSEIARGLHRFNGIGDYLHFFFQWRTLSGLFLVFLSALVLFKALSLFEFTKVIPVSIGINFVLTAFVGYLFLQESLSFTKILGIMVILAGTVILTTAKSV